MHAKFQEDWSLYKKVTGPNVLIFWGFQRFFNFQRHLSWKLFTINNYCKKQIWSEWWLWDACKISGKSKNICRSYCPFYVIFGKISIVMVDGVKSIINIRTKNYRNNKFYSSHAKFHEDWSTYMKVMAPEMLFFSTIPVTSIFEAVFLENQWQ